jgi:hypothetical protein
MAVKKTTKKAAKKTYTPAKKTTVPKLRFATLEELAVFMAKNHAKTEAAIRGLSAENRKTSATVAENHAKTEAAIRELSIVNQKTSETLQETLRSVDKLSDNVDKLSDNVDKMSDNVDKLSENIGGVNNRLGTIMELIVVPKLRHNMNTQGHNFDLSEPDKRIRGVIAGRKEDITQIDLLLRGPTEALAVEVKTRLRELHVREHLERLQDLRDREDEAGIKDKKLFGAVVGVAIDDTARKVAKENGLYIVKIHEEEGKLDIEKPETCRTW